MIDKNFDISFIADLALREKQIQQSYRPIIAVHKWFARGPGTLFRVPVLSEFIEKPLHDVYYQADGLSGIKVADPFMGGGTPLIEANRLGCDIAWFVEYPAFERGYENGVKSPFDLWCFSNLLQYPANIFGSSRINAKVNEWGPPLPRSGGEGRGEGAFRADLFSPSPCGRVDPHRVFSTLIREEPHFLQNHRISSGSTVPGWNPMNTLIEQRDAIEDLMEERISPTHGLEEISDAAYERAV